MSNEVTITEADRELLAVEYDRAFARKSASRLRSGQVMPGAIIKEPAALRAIAKARQSSLSTTMVEMRAALSKADDFISAMLDFTGQNLEVFNWHMNGDGEPFDSFVSDNNGQEALEAIRTALSKLSETESE